jgi:hypothetical protein
MSLLLGGTCKATESDERRSWEVGSRKNLAESIWNSLEELSHACPRTSSSALIGDLAVCPPKFLIVRNSSLDFERRLKINRELFRIVALFT